MDSLYDSEVLMWSYHGTPLYSGWCLKASVCTDGNSLVWHWTTLHPRHSMCTSWTTCSTSWGFDALVKFGKLRQYWNLMGANTWSIRCEALTQCQAQGHFPCCVYLLPAEMFQTPDHIHCSDAVRALSLTVIWGHRPFRDYNETVSFLPRKRITLGYQCWGTLLGVFCLEFHSSCIPGVFLLWELSVTKARGKSVLFLGRHREKRSKPHGLPPAFPNWCSCACTTMCPS